MTKRRKSLALRLLERNGKANVVESLEGRIAGRDGDKVVYSTQQQQERRLDTKAYRDKVGLESNVTRAYNPHSGNKGSNRNSFYTFGEEVCSDQEIRGRTMRK